MADNEYIAPVPVVNPVATVAGELTTRWGVPHPTRRRNVAGIGVPLGASIGARAILAETLDNSTKTLALAPGGALVGRLALESLVYGRQTAFQADTRVSHDRGRGFWRSILPFIANAAEKKVSGWILGLEGPNNSRDRAHHLLENTQVFNPLNPTEVRVTGGAYQPEQRTNGIRRPNAEIVLATPEMRRIMADRDETYRYAREAIHYAITTEALRVQGAQRNEDHFGAGNTPIKRQRLLTIAQQMIEYHVRENIWNDHLHNVVVNPIVHGIFQEAQNRYTAALNASPHDIRHARDIRNNYIQMQLPTLPAADRTALRASRRTLNARVTRANLQIAQQDMVLRIKRDLMEREQLARTTQTAAFTAIAAVKTIPMKLLLIDPIISIAGKIGNLFGGLSGIKSELNKPDIFGIGGNGDSGSHAHPLTPVQPKVDESFYVFDAHDAHPTLNHLPADGNTSAFKPWVESQAYKSMHIDPHVHLTAAQHSELIAREHFIDQSVRKLNPDLIHGNSIGHEGVVAVETPSGTIHNVTTINAMTAADHATPDTAFQKGFWNSWKTQANQPFNDIATNRPLSQAVFDATTQLNGPRYTFAAPPFFNHIDLNAVTNLPQISDFTPYMKHMPLPFQHFIAQRGLTNFRDLLSSCDTLPFDQKMRVMDYIRMTMPHVPYNLQSQLKQVLEQMTVSVPAAA